MTIKDMEERSGLPRANIRYYEAEGLLHPTRAANGYRDYSENDLNALLKIKLLRELGCSLEDISALQTGTAALSDVLAQRLDALEGEAASLARARELCARIRGEGVTYETLMPERYMGRAEPISLWSPPPEPPKHYPWRRAIARGLDYALCETAVRLFLSLGLNIGTWRNTASDVFVVTFFSMLLMVAVEPALLHFFRTTPGKWLCRLRLGRDDGAPFTYGHGALRTALVLLLGCGLFIPVLNLIALVLGFWRATHDQLQPWETDEDLFEDLTPAHKNFSWGRTIPLAILARVLCVCAIFGGELWVARLPYPNPSTPAEFTANYVKVAQYVDSEYAPVNVTMNRSDDDAPVYLPAYPINAYPGIIGDYAGFDYEGTPDRLDALILDLDISSGAVISYPGTAMACALNALEGKSALTLPGTTLYKRCVAVERGDTAALETLPDGAWHVYLDYKVSGGEYIASYQEFLPEREQTQHVTVTFRASRAE